MAKATTMESYWVPGVNHLKHFGRWQFIELKSIEHHGGRSSPRFVTEGIDKWRTQRDENAIRVKRPS